MAEFLSLTDHSHPCIASYLVDCCFTKLEWFPFTAGYSSVQTHSLDLQFCIASYLVDCCFTKRVALGTSLAT